MSRQYAYCKKCKEDVLYSITGDRELEHSYDYDKSEVICYIKEEED